MAVNAWHVTNQYASLLQVACCDLSFLNVYFIFSFILLLI